MSRSCKTVSRLPRYGAVTAHPRFSQKKKEIRLTLLVSEKKNHLFGFWENLQLENLLTVLFDLQGIKKGQNFVNIVCERHLPLWIFH